ncbi:MAG: hypothetical protein U0942_02195 [Parvibaculum sp.]|uniref:hypothetical protein n=1 Tax=Parvibaculum sp. TaxID=2024848 RepID=UPI000CBD66B8|nr:hypothetical protein [Parvibaculum sp.]MDZ4380133.1 hypothetical protein [Parvibaculum sp.]PKP77657.1 MAG: hypothetical protein CVT81_08405 [Alphaproteobacteria bacterium HGW-Alphaproteobacteria-3]
MHERRSPSRLAGKEATETPLADVRFVRVPSIAERKLGADYVAPMRLDPRVLAQMQTTIRDLETKYAESLKSQVAMLQILVEPACKGDPDARRRLYALAHDMRGLAGTFGHAIVGQFADSLCRYIENLRTEDWDDGTVVTFHVDAIRDALENPGTDPTVTMETLNALDRLIGSGRHQRTAG